MELVLLYLKIGTHFNNILNTFVTAIAFKCCGVSIVKNCWISFKQSILLRIFFFKYSKSKSLKLHTATQCVHVLHVVMTFTLTQNVCICISFGLVFAWAIHKWYYLAWARITWNRYDLTDTTQYGDSAFYNPN